MGVWNSYQGCEEGLDMRKVLKEAGENDNFGLFIMEFVILIRILSNRPKDYGKRPYQNIVKHY